MGGLTRRPIQIKPQKPRKETPRPPKVLPETANLEDEAFGKKVPVKNPKASE